MGEILCDILNNGNIFQQVSGFKVKTFLGFFLQDGKGKSPFRVIPFENVHIFTLTLQKKRLAPSSHSLDAAPALL